MWIFFPFLFLSLGVHGSQEFVSGDRYEADEEHDDVNAGRIKPESNLVKNKKMKFMDFGKTFNTVWKKLNWNDFHLAYFLTWIIVKWEVGTKQEVQGLNLLYIVNKLREKWQPLEI